METAASSEITFLAAHAPGPLTEGLTSSFLQSWESIWFSWRPFKSCSWGIIQHCWIFAGSLLPDWGEKKKKQHIFLLNPSGTYPCRLLQQHVCELSCLWGDKLLLSIMCCFKQRTVDTIWINEGMTWYLKFKCGLNLMHPLIASAWVQHLPSYELSTGANTIKTLSLPLGCSSPLRAEKKLSQRTSFHSLHKALRVMADLSFLLHCLKWLAFLSGRYTTAYRHCPNSVW